MSTVDLARNRPSSFELFMLCPGARRMTARAPRSTSRYAAEGTAAHTLIEQCLAAGLAPFEWLRQTIDGFVVDGEMADAATKFVVRVLEDRKDADLFGSEVKLRMPDVLDMPERGTVDAWAWKGSTALLRVRDYKHGAGVFVGIGERAEDDGRLLWLNAQLGSYAWALVEWIEATYVGEMGVKWIEMSIIQPRIKRAGGYERSFTLRRDELVAWVYLTAQPAVLASRAPNAPLIPGPHCREKFCDARGACLTYAGWKVSNLIDDTPPPPTPRADAAPLFTPYNGD